MNVTIVSRPILRGLRAVRVAPEAWEELGMCPVCRRTAGVRDVAAVAQHGSAAGVLAACLDCEYAFFRRRPAARWFESFYAHDWDFGRRNGNRLTAAVPLTSRVLDFCRPDVAAGTRVFEIGAGLGASLRAFHDAGYQVDAVEPSQHRARFVREVMRLPCEATPIERIARSEPYDLVYINHVLEHVFDPAVTIAAAASLVRSGGWLYVAVPNLWNECMAQTVHYVPHLSVFTSRSLEKLLLPHGFAIHRVELQHDIQLLARRVSDNSLVPGPSSGDFWTRLSGLTVDGFGRGPGRHAVVWFPIGDHGYHRMTLSSAQMPALRVALAIESRLPRGVSRRLTPAFWQRRVRALAVDVRGPLELPARVEHRGDMPPVWVK